MTDPRAIAHRYARMARQCDFNKHSDRHQEHSKFCDDLCAEIKVFGWDSGTTAMRQVNRIDVK